MPLTKHDDETLGRMWDEFSSHPQAGEFIENALAILDLAKKHGFAEIESRMRQYLEWVNSNLKKDQPKVN